MNRFASLAAVFVSVSLAGTVEAEDRPYRGLRCGGGLRVAEEPEVPQHRLRPQQPHDWPAIPKEEVAGSAATVPENSGQALGYGETVSGRSANYPTPAKVFAGLRELRRNVKEQP
ncbi:MAG: hypothetical protein CMJ78_18485 [Planctomycetaceae bacterium]|nr:hypothetical protein [Planctomycetaceae bacterium]